MIHKPLPLELLKSHYSPEALRDLAERVGQFDDARAFRSTCAEAGARWSRGWRLDKGFWWTSALVLAGLILGGVLG
jgi:hypothetical protein